MRNLQDNFDQKEMECTMLRSNNEELKSEAGFLGQILNQTKEENQGLKTILDAKQKLLEIEIQAKQVCLHIEILKYIDPKLGCKDLKFTCKKQNQCQNRPTD